MSRPKDSRGSNRYKGNQLMIGKVMDAVDAACESYVQHQRDDFRDNIRHGSERRGAAQAKRERKMAKRAAQAKP